MFLLFFLEIRENIVGYIWRLTLTETTTEVFIFDLNKVKN